MQLNSPHPILLSILTATMLSTAPDSGAFAAEQSPREVRGLKLYPPEADLSRGRAALTNPGEPRKPPPTGPAYLLVEEFTANTLSAGGIKIGSESEYGLTDRVSFGFDTYALAVGVPSIHFKTAAYIGTRDRVALGARFVWLSLGNLASFARAKDHFQELDAKVLRPTLAWTRQMSPRLAIHGFWTMSIGDVRAELSEEGRRLSFESKHPGGDFDTGRTEPEEPATAGQGEDEGASSRRNQEKVSEDSSSITRRTLELQPLFGLSTDRFQISGEFSRSSGDKVLVSTRIEIMEIEELRARSISLTVAHHWIFGSFQTRLGLGAQYLVINGEDLDGEKVDETRVNPIPELAFYWRF